MPSQSCCGKGTIKALKKKYPDANIAAVDYDPGASEVNQLNRIKLMLSGAKENISNRKCRKPKQFNETNEHKNDCFVSV